MIGLLHFVTDLISMKTLPNYIITSSQNITASIYFQNFLSRLSFYTIK